MMIKFSLILITFLFILTSPALSQETKHPCGHPRFDLAGITDFLMMRHNAEFVDITDAEQIEAYQNFVKSNLPADNLRIFSSKKFTTVAVILSKKFQSLSNEQALIFFNCVLPESPMVRQHPPDKLQSVLLTGADA